MSFNKPALTGKKNAMHLKEEDTPVIVPSSSSRRAGCAGRSQKRQRANVRHTAGPAALLITAERDGYIEERQLLVE
jgi:hypothetical protein